MTLKRDATIRARLIFGGAVCIMFTSVVATLIFLPIPTENRSAVDILLGTLSATMGAVFNFYFGSSEGSHSKEDIINKSLNRTQEAITDTIPPYDDNDGLGEVKQYYDKVEDGYKEQDNPDPAYGPLEDSKQIEKRTGVDNE